MALLRRRPSRELVSLHDAIDRMFDENFMQPTWTSSWPELDLGTIPLDIIEEDKNLIVKASVPGVTPEALEVELRDDMLTVTAKLDKEEEHKGGDYHLREHRYGQYTRSVKLPVPVTNEHAAAVYENGVLTLTLPKVDDKPSKRISINVKR